MQPLCGSHHRHGSRRTKHREVLFVGTVQLDLLYRYAPSCEREISLLSSMFGEQPDDLLAEVWQISLMLRSNRRMSLTVLSRAFMLSYFHAKQLLLLSKSTLILIIMLVYSSVFEIY